MDLSFSARLNTQDRAGAGIMGSRYVYAAVSPGAVRLLEGSADGVERELSVLPYEKTELLLRMRIRDGQVSFFFGSCGTDLRPLGTACPMEPGGWTGARPGIFCLTKESCSDGYADFRSVRLYER